jgi:hypothetical protein
LLIFFYFVKILLLLESTSGLVCNAEMFLVWMFLCFIFSCCTVPMLCWKWSWVGWFIRLNRQNGPYLREQGTWGTYNLQSLDMLHIDHGFLFCIFSLSFYFTFFMIDRAEHLMGHSHKKVVEIISLYHRFGPN